jgi:hypothetical protein
VEPEKRPLLANGSETTFVSRQRPRNRQYKEKYMSAARERLGKHVPAETVRIQEWTVLSARAAPRSYKEDNWGNQFKSLRESVKKRLSWKGAAVQRRLEPGSRGRAIVRSRFKKTFIEGTECWKRLINIYKVWKWR